MTRLWQEMDTTWIEYHIYWKQWIFRRK